MHERPDRSRRRERSSAGRSPGSSVLAVHLPAREFSEQWFSAHIGSRCGTARTDLPLRGQRRGCIGSLHPRRTGFPFHPPRGSARRTPAGRNRSENPRALPCNAWEARLTQRSTAHAYRRIYTAGHSAQNWSESRHVERLESEGGGTMCRMCDEGMLHEHDPQQPINSPRGSRRGSFDPGSRSTARP